MQKVVLLLICTILLNATTIDKKIKIKKRELNSVKIEYNKMDKKLSGIAKKILDAKKQRAKLEKRVKLLEKRILDNQAEYDKYKEKKKVLDDQLKDLNREILSKQDIFVGLVADKFSMALVLEEIKKPTPESVMLQEAYHVYAKENEKEIQRLKEDIHQLKIKKEYFVNKEENIQRILTGYKKERTEYKNKKLEKTKLIKALARDKAIYKKRFDRIRESQRTLRKKLAKLNIIKEEKKIEKEVQQEKKKTDKREKKSVKREASSVKGVKYSGSKTISPLKNSRLIKKFGTYIDPIYKFKIFNKSITLKASYKGAKVKSVLNGKIVFAENSGGMLGKVVIIEHAQNIHTIYAKLTRLAPGIHVGKHVSKGSVIGKVDKSLMFEVTKNNKHMNPLNLIQL